jgi:hypothetical protein
MQKQESTRASEERRGEDWAGEGYKYKTRKRKVGKAQETLIRCSAGTHASRMRKVQSRESME